MYGVIQNRDTVRVIEVKPLWKGWCENLTSISWPWMDVYSSKIFFDFSSFIIITAKSDEKTKKNVHLKKVLFGLKEIASSHLYSQSCFTPYKSILSECTDFVRRPTAEKKSIEESSHHWRHNFQNSDNLTLSVKYHANVTRKKTKKEQIVCQTFSPKILVWRALHKKSVSLRSRVAGKLLDFRQSNPALTNFVKPGKVTYYSFFCEFEYGHTKY